MRGTNRPTLLYITPVTPAETGNGLAMRAANVLRALVRHYDVTVLILPLYPPGPSGNLPGWVKQHTSRVLRKPSARAVRKRHFDVVHLFRMATLPYAEGMLDPNLVGEWHIDLDDVESKLPGNTTADTEHRLLKTWERVYVCSDGDRDYLIQTVPDRRADVVVLPNSVHLPAEVTAPPAGTPRNLLMTGTFDYRPNAEGAIWFCREVLPIIREQTPVPVSVSLVGAGPPEDVLDLAWLPEVRHIGPVPEMPPWYRRADIVIAPILQGSGTRIKILEALAHARPVVSTNAGAYGLNLTHGRDLLIADRPHPFAQHCLQLIQDSCLARQIGRLGRDTVAAQYSHERVAAGFIPSFPKQPH